VGMSSQDPLEFRITQVTPSRAQERAHRQRTYLISMGVRVACFLTAILVPAPLPVRMALIAGAIALPYFAVVVANASRSGSQRPVTGVGSLRVKRPEIED